MFYSMLWETCGLPFLERSWLFQFDSFRRSSGPSWQWGGEEPFARGMYLVVTEPCPYLCVPYAHTRRHRLPYIRRETVQLLDLYGLMAKGGNLCHPCIYFSARF